MTSNVTCDYASAVWEVNSAGQNACQVYAQLQGQCNTSFIIQSALATTPPYTPPNNECGCNVVAYNLQAGCGWCQQPIPSGWWLTINQWAGNCTNFPYNPSAIPASVNTASITIPQWALAIPTGTSWEPSQASVVAVSASPSSSFGFSFVTTSAASTTRAPNGNGQLSGNDFGGRSSTIASAAIIGITMAVLLALWLFITAGMVGVYFMRDARRKAWYGPMGTFYAGQKGSYGYGYGGSYGHYQPNNYPGSGGTAPFTHPHAGAAYPPNGTPSTGTPVGGYQPPPAESPLQPGGSAGSATYSSSYVPPPPESSHHSASSAHGAQNGTTAWGGNPSAAASTASVYGNGNSPYGRANASSLYGSQTALNASGTRGAGVQAAVGYRGQAELH